MSLDIDYELEIGLAASEPQEGPVEDPAPLLDEAEMQDVVSLHAWAKWRLAEVDRKAKRQREALRVWVARRSARPAEAITQTAPLIERYGRAHRTARVKSWKFPSGRIQTRPHVELVVPDEPDMVLLERLGLIIPQIDVATIAKYGEMIDVERVDPDGTTRTESVFGIRGHELPGFRFEETISVFVVANTDLVEAMDDDQDDQDDEDDDVDAR